MLPRLKRAGEDDGSGRRWEIPPPSFGREGLEGLVRSLAHAFEDTGRRLTPESVRLRLAAAPEADGVPKRAVRALRELASDLLVARRMPDGHILLVLDQLEEVFGTAEGSEARIVLRLLLDATADAASPVVILTSSVPSAAASGVTKPSARLLPTRQP